MKIAVPVFQRKFAHIRSRESAPIMHRMIQRTMKKARRKVPTPTPSTSDIFAVK